ncbi:hypothetical protein BJ742DRAFT_290490 [Cladochytrium replicatum]|nr:hypothetical protein BJ742DRAFT_290490 [Cladochytrium replicatum]
MGSDSGIPVKVSYNGSVRKFVVPWEGTSWSEFERLMKSVHNINEPILATYLDQDREFIAFDTDAELAALLSAIPRDGRTTLRVFVKTLSQLERSNAILPPPSSTSPSHQPQKFPDDLHHSGGSNSEAYASKEFSDTSYRSQTTSVRGRLPSVDENWNIVMDSGNYHPGALRASAGSAAGLHRSYAHDSARDSVQSQAPSMMSSYVSQDNAASVADTMGALTLDDQAAKKAVAASVGDAGGVQGKEREAQMKALVNQLRESFAGHPEVLKQLDVVWSKVSADNSSANLDYAIGEINRVIQVFQSTPPASTGSAAAAAPRRVVRNAGFQPELPSAGKLDRAELDRKSVTLHEMGFTDDDLNMALLIEFEGDIERCVEILSNGV